IVGRVARAVMAMIVRAAVSVMMTVGRVARAEMAMIVRAAVSVTRVTVLVVRVVMMTGLRVGRSVTTTGHRGRNANPGRRQSVASVR
ncbi:MAG: hypothetical protein RLZZ526_931, partial [Actinomycetota bacterium]